MQLSDVTGNSLIQAGWITACGPVSPSLQPALFHGCNFVQMMLMIAFLAVLDLLEKDRVIILPVVGEERA